MAEFYGITIFILLAAISPGPDFAMVVRNSLLHGRKSGIMTALGVSSSLLIHASYCMLGLAIIISKSLLLFSIIKYIGAAYLIYLGIKSVKAKRESETIAVEMTDAMKKHQGFLQGFLCNLLNPKAIMFILAFFTLIIRPDTSWQAQIGYGIEIAVIHIIWFSFLAVMITHPRVKDNLAKIQHYIVKTMGVVLIGFGARIAFIRHA